MVSCQGTRPCIVNLLTMPSEDKLGEEISTRVINEYSKLKSACRPIIRPSGIREWTILAGVAAINRDGGANKIEILSIATGVKALQIQNYKEVRGRFCMTVMQKYWHYEVLIQFY